MSAASVLAFFSKAWQFLIAVVIAVPALASLYFWGRGWKRRAESAEAAVTRARLEAQAAIRRGARERQIRDVEARARQALTMKLESKRRRIEDLEAEVLQARTAAERINKALVLGEVVDLPADEVTTEGE